MLKKKAVVYRGYKFVRLIISKKDIELSNMLCRGCKCYTDNPDRYSGCCEIKDDEIRQFCNILTPNYARTDYKYVIGD